MVTMYFAGYGLGAFTKSWPDTMGRKWSSIVGLALSLVCETLMLCTPNYYVRTAGFFGMGLSQVKNVSAPLWLSECVGQDKKDKTVAYTIVSTIDGLPIFVMYLYIMIGGKNWFYLNLVIVLIGYSALAVLFLCPESPEWLLMEGRREDAISAFNSIAWWNDGEKILEN